MIAFLSNAFNDPNDPWYYVLGVLMLVLLFGGLALYIYFSGKGKKKKANEEVDKSDAPIEKTDEKNDPENTEEEKRSDKAMPEEQPDLVQTEDDKQDKTE